MSDSQSPAPESPTTACEERPAALQPTHLWDMVALALGRGDCLVDVAGRWRGVGVG
jgi:hypothetical protein